MFSLDNAVLDILSQGDISEFELIKRLQSAPYNLLNKEAFGTDLQLFQTHFVLFNCLYRLQKLGYESQSYMLSIIATCISKLPYSEASARALTSDVAEAKLSEYYLDWDNFKQTDAQQVESLLSDFWQRFVKRQNCEEITQALEALQLSEMPSKSDLKKQFKLLSLKHHPDKNGDQTRYQQIVIAYNFLKDSA